MSRHEFDDSKLRAGQPWYPKIKDNRIVVFIKHLANIEGIGSQAVISIVHKGIGLKGLERVLQIYPVCVCLLNLKSKLPKKIEQYISVTSLCP